MNTYAADYKRKLTTLQKAMEKIRNGDTIVHGLSTAEPPALLAAIADRAREGDLKDINIYSLLPLKHAAETVLAPDLSDCIQAYSWFVSGAGGPSRAMQRRIPCRLPVQRHRWPG